MELVIQVLILTEVVCLCATRMPLQKACFHLFCPPLTIDKMAGQSGISILGYQPV